MTHYGMARKCHMTHHGMAMSHEISKPGYVRAMSQPRYVAENVPTSPMFVVEIKAKHNNCLYHI